MQKHCFNVKKKAIRSRRDDTFDRPDKYLVLTSSSSASYFPLRFIRSFASITTNVHVQIMFKNIGIILPKYGYIVELGLKQYFRVTIYIVQRELLTYLSKDQFLINNPRTKIFTLKLWRCITLPCPRSYNHSMILLLK